MKRRKYIALLVCVVLAGMGATVRAQEASADTIMKHIRYLSSSRYEGRQAGTQGYVDAADYVINALRSYGVKPYEKGEWMKYIFDVESNQVENASLFTYVHKDDVRQPYVLGKDFACVSMTGRGYADAPVVFCGYGIDNNAFNEYAKVDAKGKIVMVLTGVPKFLPQSVTEKYATLRDKARTALAHGAVALVAVNMSETCRPTEVQCQMFCGNPPHLFTFPMLQATRWCGNELLKNEKMTIDSVLTMMDSTHKPHSFLLDKKFAIDVNATYNPTAKTGNVVGFVEGRDLRLKREVVIVGAYLDHLGIQGETCLFPGADQNATGVAAVLEVARMLSQADEWQGRSVAFVFFSGGEHRHKGAEAFVRTFKDLEWVDAFLNIESVGSGDSIAVMGKKRFPILWSIVSHNDSLYTQLMKQEVNTMPQGDAVAFAKLGIPAVNIFTTNGHRYNHVPSDIAENVNRRMVTSATTLLYRTLMQLCNGDYQGRAEESRYNRFENTYDDVDIYSTGSSIDSRR